MKRGNLNIVSDKESDTIDIADIDLDLKENNFLKVGDWFYGITGEGGFGQIVKVCHQFYEEYSRIPIGKKVGDYDKTLFIIKYFCSFDFKPNIPCISQLLLSWHPDQERQLSYVFPHRSSC